MLTQENNQNQTLPSMSTLTACVNKVVKDGYTDSFKVTRQGLYSAAKDKSYAPDQVHVVNFFRFEGESDPSDNSIMYVIETHDGLKGTLIDAYGAYSDNSVNVFMKEVEDMNKKVNKRDHSLGCKARYTGNLIKIIVIDLAFALRKCRKQQIGLLLSYFNR